MATTQAASSTAVAVGGGTVAAILETIVGSHILKIDGSSATKDLGVGKSIKSSTFNVGGHDWYIECYPCGEDDEENGGWVSLFLCLHVHKEQVEAGCEFGMIEDEENRLSLFENSIGSKHTFNADTSWRCGSTRMFKRKKLESLLKDDCLEVRCDVYVVKEFAAMPPPDLHRPLSDLLASGMPGDLTFQVSGELFTVHRGLPAGPSAHVVAASPTSTGASSSTVARISSGSHVLTIDGYSKTKKMFRPDDLVVSEDFVVGGRRWFIALYPSLEHENGDSLKVFLTKNEPDEGEVVKVRLEFTLLSFAREIISSTQFCYAFTTRNERCSCDFPFNTETEPLIGDGFHVKCDVNIVKEITAVRPPDLHRHFGNLLASQVGTDVTFEVGGELLSAHKLVLATRSSAFMAEFFGPAAGKKAGASGGTTAVARVRIVDMEARVFKALLHFIYTDTLPEVREDDDDRIVMAQGLLVAADRYAMERLKLICADMLCSYVNDARAAFGTLELADKYGCRRLKEACMRLLKGHFAKVAGP